MTAYYRQSVTGKPYGPKTYAAVAETPVENPWGGKDYPYGQVDVWVQPNTYEVSEDNTQNDGALFKETPGHIQVASAFFDRSMRHTFPTTMALIKNEFPGKDFVVGDDLSQHSARLANKFMGTGMVKPDDKDDNAAFYEGKFSPTNNYDFTDMSLEDPEYIPNTYKGVTKVDESDVARAKTTVRNIIRKGRDIKRPQSAQKLSPQFEQLKLPGVG